MVLNIQKINLNIKNALSMVLYDHLKKSFMKNFKPVPNFLIII